MRALNLIKHDLGFVIAAELLFAGAEVSASSQQPNKAKKVKKSSTEERRGEKKVSDF